MNLKHLLKVNIFLITTYLVFYFLNDYFESLFFLKAIIGLLIIFLSGINFAILLKILSKKKFDFWEIINFSFLAIILFFPTLLFIEFLFLKSVYQFFPIMNFIIFSSFLFIIAKIKKIDWENNFISTPKIKIRGVLSSPLFTILIIKLIIVISIFSAYEFLPDKDPFKWLFRLSDLFEKNALSPETYRPFFSGITYIFTQITGISIFYFFKYIIPLFSLSIIFPVWLIARRMKNKNTQLLMLLASLMTSNVILYSQTAMPQIFAIFLTYYFISFLLYYHQTKDFFYYVSAGLISFFAIFFHEISAILFFAWLIVTFLFFRKNLSLGKKDIIYIIIIILSNASLLKANFIYKWIKKILTLLKDLHPNLLFPAYYTNIDGNAMGWSGLMGILKFYSFYVGPFLFFIFALIIYFLIKDCEFRRYFKQKIRNKELIILLICFLVFFSISEIIPRILGISLLPDRSWVFGGIFSTVFLFVILSYLEKKNIFNKKFYLISFISLIIVIYGSAYINSQKKFLITENEMNSAKWITKNLPGERVFLSTSSASIIKYYSKSNLFPVSEKFYYDESSLEFIEKRETYATSESYLVDYYNNIKKTSDNLGSLLKNEPEKIMQNTDIFFKTANDNIKYSKTLINEINLSKKSSLANSQNLYIYYSGKSSKNPYTSRPYELAKNYEVNKFIFDNYPEKFIRIYEKNGDGKVIIWKVL